MPVKVCHLTSAHNILDDRIFIKECIGLAAKGFDVTIIGCGESENEYIENEVKLISLFVPVRSRIQRVIRRTKALYHKALEINADIYHLHDPELLHIGLKLKKKDKKVVYDAHEDLPRQIFQKEWIPIFLRKSFSVLFECIENYYVVRLNAIVTVTNHISNRFSEFCKKVIVCSNYASLTEFTALDEWGESRNRICYVGVISKLRGIEEVIEATDKTGVSLELAGYFESRALERQIISQKFVNFRGFVNRNELKILYSRCFAGIVTLHPAPNITHSLPIKMFEYMASGIPVIASRFEDWIPIVEGNKAGLCVDPMSIDDISEAILYLKTHPDIARQMGQNGRRAIEEKYNWQIEEKKLIALYNEIICP